MTARFHAFGLGLHRFRWAVLAVWLVLVAFGVFGAQRAHDVLKGSAGGIPGSGSARAAELLHSKFVNPYQYNFLVTITSDKLTLDGDRYPVLIRDLEHSLDGLPFVTRTFSYLDHPLPYMRDAAGHRTFFLVGLKAKDGLAAELDVKPVRRALKPVIAQWQAQDPSLQVYVTGETPIGYDGTQVLIKDTGTAEKRIIPIAIVFLLLAFGGLAASGIPVLVGATASVITLGLLVLFAQFMNLSAFAQNISSMVGLGVGIDYSLIIVSRFREALGRELPVREAIAETVASAGQAVVYSGLTVMIGFLALFLPNLIDTNSLALAGSLTVLVSVLLALTLLPAVLSILGHRIDWPFGLSRFIGRFSVSDWWYRWARLVMRYPARFLVGGTLVLIALSTPMLGVKFGQFSTKFLPQGMESGAGLVQLEKMDQAGQLYPISIVIETTDHSMIFAPRNMQAIAGVVRGLRADPVVDSVHSIVENASSLILLDNLFFRGDVAALRRRFPEAASLLISKDGTGTVIQVVPKTSASYASIKAFTRALQDRNWSQVPGMAHMEVALGGAAPSNNDFEAAILNALPKVVALVFVITFVLLYMSFRSVLLPIKALLMNTLSVSASFGALVLVFQNGVGSWLVGFPEAPGVILVAVPIVVFCCVFGLSMDYEVFLLSRIKEEYDRTGDNETAVAAGLAATGGIITNAALIMLLVFGAFIAANVVLTKMLGFGLAVAVLVDALVIRVMLVPSFMALMGKWNWWPHIHARERAPEPRETVGVGPD
ncbi:MAG TPA: MMPL family transporter [Oscillatoriaceae cyanobacterium]